MFTEDMEPRRAARAGYAKDLAEVEGYVRGFARRRPDVRVTTVRAANVVGPHVTSPLTSYLRLPVVPTVLGFDPRLQLLHEQDLIDVLRHTTATEVAGTFNVAGDGVLMLSQAVRRLGRPTVPVPPFALSGAASLTSQAGVRGLSGDLTELLTFGRGVDTTRMRTVLGFEPVHTTSTAFADFARSLGARVGAPAPEPPAAGRPAAGVTARAAPSSTGRRHG
jgi:UDP-glucose 4-epimerase